MQSENEIGARHLLHVFHDLLVAFAFGDFLVVPMRKRMRADRRDFHSAARRQPRQPAAQIDHMRAGIDH